MILALGNFYCQFVCLIWRVGLLLLFFWRTVYKLLQARQELVYQIEKEIWTAAWIPFSAMFQLLIQNLWEKKHSCITVQVWINFGSNFDYMKAIVADIVLIHFDAHFIFVKKDFRIGCGEDESRKWMSCVLPHVILRNGFIFSVIKKRIRWRS